MIDETRTFIPLHIQFRQGDVQRCGLARKIKGYDLKQHGFGVLSIMLDLAYLLGVDSFTEDEIRIILRHDILETFTGDLPWVIKNLNSTTQKSWEAIENEVLGSGQVKSAALETYTDEFIEKTFSPIKYNLFKLADMLDLLFYCAV